MEEGMTITKVPDWMVLKPEMMRHLIREHEKLGRHADRRRASHVTTQLGIRKSANRRDEEQRAPMFW